MSCDGCLRDICEVAAATSRSQTDIKFLRTQIAFNIVALLAQMAYKSWEILNSNKHILLRGRPEMSSTGRVGR